MKRLEFVALVLLAALVISACSAIDTSSLTSVVDRLNKPVEPEPTVNGNPAEGEALFHTFQPVAGIACSTCHRVDTDEQLVGPGLLHVGERAAQRVPGTSAADYIRQSIVDPSAYVVEGYRDLMPKNFSHAFTTEQIDDLVAYLISLSAPVTS